MSKLHFTLTIDDGEMIMLEEALSHYQARCEQELANGVACPFEAHAKIIQEFRSKLYNHIHLPGTFSREQLVETRRKADEIND